MKVLVVDAGQMGTTKAVMLSNAGHDVTLMIQPFDYPHIDLYIYLSQTGKTRQGKRENNLHLSGVDLPENLKFTDTFDNTEQFDFIFLAVPSKFLMSSYIKIRENLALNNKCTLVLLSKGWDDANKLPWGLSLYNDLRASNKSHQYAVLSGYTPAYCIANSHLTLFSYAASAASHNLNAIKKIYHLFRNTRLGIAGTTDIIGVSWGGMLKNAYAIGYGILSAEKDGQKSRKYLEKAHDEMKVFLKHFGASENTWSSPSVNGDFYLTSQGQIDWTSRNVAFGEFLSKFQKPKDIHEYTDKHTVEGYDAMYALWAIAHHNKLEVPILYAIHRIICLSASPCNLIDTTKRL